MKYTMILRMIGLTALALPGVVWATDYDVNANGTWTTPGTWTPTGNPTTGDTITLDSGFAGTRTVGLSGADTVYNIDSISFNDTNTVVFQSTANSPILAIGGNLGKDGDGTLTFNQNGGNLRVTIGGNLLVSDGTLNVGTGSASTNRIQGFSAVSTTIASGATVNVNANGTTNAAFGATTLNGSFNLTSGENTRGAAFAGLTGSGTIRGTTEAAATGHRITFTQTSGISNFSGVIQNGSASGLGVTMAGAGGTQALSGNNTYTGVTAVSAGTLLINGDNSAATGNVTVSSGATLGGIGTVGGNTTLSAGGRLSPGNSPGAITFAENLTFTGLSYLDFEGGDLVNVESLLSLSGTWSLVLGTGFVDGGQTVIFNFDTNSLAAGALDAARIDAAGLGFSPIATLSLEVVGNSIVLNGISAIPEPGTCVLLTAGLGLLLWRRRTRLVISS